MRLNTHDFCDRLFNVLFSAIIITELLILSSHQMTFGMRAVHFYCHFAIINVVIIVGNQNLHNLFTVDIADEKRFDPFPILEVCDFNYDL